MRTELGIFEKGKRVLVSSRFVAHNFEKRHNSVVATIESVIKDVGGSTSAMYTPYFKKQTYINEQNNQEYTEYLLNKRAFILTMFRLKGKIAFELQNQYIDTFETMEAALQERHQWRVEDKEHQKAAMAKIYNGLQLQEPTKKHYVKHNTHRTVQGNRHTQSRYKQLP